MPRQICRNKAEADDLPFATLTIKIYIPNRRSEFVSWDWIDKCLIKKECNKTFFWEESVTILPFDLQFHLLVILQDSTERLQRQFRLFCAKYDESNYLSSVTFLPYNNSNRHAISILKRTEINFFQGLQLVTENIKDLRTTTSLQMGFLCRQQN